MFHAQSAAALVPRSGLEGAISAADSARAPEAMSGDPDLSAGNNQGGELDIEEKFFKGQ